MDVDKDGIISAEDVKNIFEMNGISIPDSQANSMVKEAGAALNFTVFLTLFGERLTGRKFTSVQIFVLMLRNLP